MATDVEFGYPPPGEDVSQPRAALPEPSVSLPRFVSGLSTLVDSSEPAVVFTALAGLCVPALCDACTISIEETDGICYRIVVPDPAPAADRHLDTSGAGLAEATLRVPILWEAEPGPAFRGVMDCTWCDHQPATLEAALAAMSVEVAVAAVRRSRSEISWDLARRDAEQLASGLLGNRQIGIAVGILMSRRLVDRDAAFELLRQASMQSNRKLRDIAVEVADAGELPDPRSRVH